MLDVLTELLDDGGIIATFQLKAPDSFELMAKTMGVPNVDYTELFDPRQRIAGHALIELDEHSEGKSRSRTTTIGRSTTKGESVLPCFRIGIESMGEQNLSFC